MVTTNRQVEPKADERGISIHTGQRLQQLYQEALRYIEPILTGNDVAPASIRVYRAMEKLHLCYPDLSEAELEALLSGLLKFRLDAAAH